ncbi:MAG: AMP-binding protein [Sodaliphilus pleomorphus]|jgi:long-chain acyl-CoA synthetase|uniref:Long-chain fatty acid--CoA ligase n=1 Tax=Sodaliphilus pleomorphus TaxID=2606626 RepID=A0A6L5XCY2_9BACT|nr:AMP-binding protein [Sodaliphilus pleomorphus]MCI5980507.1 AMP-binding protein [Muribaculaceae bacterium]MDD7065134.1 AMP-binding protein [Sodaliphilus pleomorphus]MDY2831563.1 AMP-binding protein [Sodaliphilus pleomorphus]MSS16624.1 long-chain fatty acid--CoA ligase [Sodaliphilus pleomorphus]
MMKENTIKIFSRSFKENWDLPAVTDYNTKSTLTYGEFAQLIAKIHLFYNEIGIKRGDHIALIGKNTPSWVATFMATITYGAVIVPILQEFNPNDAQHIINHSDSVLLMSSKAVFDSIDFDMLHKVRAAISLDDVSLLAQKEGETVGEALAKVDDLFKAAYPDGFTPAHVKYPEIDNKELMVINYTSGTTGFSKGVMITGNNLAGNIVYGIDSQLCFRGSKVVSFLPLAHAYGCAFDMLCQLAVGAHITLLGRIPSPKIIVKAMNEIHPNLVITVPLVLEKIYTKLIVPKISKGMLRWALAVPLLDNRIYDQIRKQLVDAFGGNFEEVIVGGAPFNAEVEEFLYKIRFPFTVGYGMTECAPLVSHTPWREFVLHSAGRVLPGIMEAKILSDDPENTPGEICVRGENVMMGYYHNYEATDKVLDDDGWLHTGDMGTLSPDGTIFIRGRLKTMLLGANGQNIYPEEIEAKLNNMAYVNESLVVEREGKLVGLVYPDYDVMDAQGITRDKLPDLMAQVLAELNKLVAPYERLSRIELMANEFQKTPKRSIKRFLYSH